MVFEWVICQGQYLHQYSGLQITTLAADPVRQIQIAGMPAPALREKDGQGTTAWRRQATWE